MSNYFGGFLEIDEKENIETTLNEIEKEDAIKIIELSLNYAAKSGLYDVFESYILQRCLQKLKEKTNDKKD